MPQSQTADNHMAARGIATQPQPSRGRQIKQSNFPPHQDDCNTRMDISNAQQTIEQ